MVKNVSLVVLGAVALVLVGLLVTRPVQVVQVPLGANAGPDSYWDSAFFEEAQFDRVGYGGTLYLALAAPTTLTAAQVCDTRVIDMTPTSTAAITFPSAANLISDCLQRVGAQKDLYIRNLGLGDSSSTTFVAGASSSIRFLTSTSTELGTSTLRGGWSANVKLIYATSSDASNAKIEVILQTASSTVR